MKKELYENSPVGALLQLIDEADFGCPAEGVVRLWEIERGPYNLSMERGVWKGTAIMLERMLTSERGKWRKLLAKRSRPVGHGYMSSLLKRVLKGCGKRARETDDGYWIIHSPEAVG